MKKIIFSLVLFLWFYQWSFADSKLYFLSGGSLYSQETSYTYPPVEEIPWTPYSVWDYLFDSSGNLYYSLSDNWVNFSNNLYKRNGNSSWTGTVFYTAPNLFQIPFVSSISGTGFYFFYPYNNNGVSRLDMNSLSVTSLFTDGNFYNTLPFERNGPVFFQWPNTGIATVSSPYSYICSWVIPAPRMACITGSINFQNLRLVFFLMARNPNLVRERCLLFYRVQFAWVPLANRESLRPVGLR